MRVLLDELQAAFGDPFLIMVLEVFGQPAAVNIRLVEMVDALNPQRLMKFLGVTVIIPEQGDDLRIPFRWRVREWDDCRSCRRASTCRPCRWCNRPVGEAWAMFFPDQARAACPNRC